MGEGLKRAVLAARATRPPKLTKAQSRVLAALLRCSLGLDVWRLGRNPCEALRKRGLIQSADGIPLTRPIGRFDGNPVVIITDAGRQALETSAHD